ncbi:prolipoprotein diacylglyceryl transferase [Rhodobacterales bacterium 52_120_T64]|nr:prolipoprotein diacylglyceryl transferase [Rhodobacterales bacterium 52_120_T64]
MLLALPFPNIDPEIFAFDILGFNFALRWYALAYIGGLIIGWRVIVRLMKREPMWKAGAPMSADKAEDLLTWLILGVVLGGRLGFVLFYQSEYYFANPAEILKVWQGGMSFHGGFAGVIVATVLYSRHHKLPLWSVADAIAVAAPIGLFLGRIANFIRPELWGRPTTAPWGVEFPGADCPDTWLLVCTRHPSQLYEAGLEGLLLGFVILWLVARFRALHFPGMITGVFFLGYGLARMFVELFRQADAQFVSLDNPFGYVISLGNAGLTQGQILSLPMVFIGIALIFWSRRST